MKSPFGEIDSLNDGAFARLKWRLSAISAFAMSMVVLMLEVLALE